MTRFALTRRSPENRLRYLEDEVVRLTAENALFAEALAAATHAYERCGAGVACDSACDSCGADVRRGGAEQVCCGLRDDPVHQTPGAVRARLAGGAA